MKIAIIGRSKSLYEAAKSLNAAGHQIKLIITAKEAPEYSITSKDFEVLAKQYDAKFIYTARINEEEVFEEIRKCGELELGVSINYSGIISDKIIDFFPNGILNAHGGDLPKYRGNACQAWAMLNCESKIGLCIHKMIGNELDSGPIVEREYMSINIDTRIGEIYDWMDKSVPDMIVSAVDKLAQNPSYVLEYQSSDPALALRCYPRNPKDGKVDWGMSASTIIRLVNASSEPFNGAYCIYENEPMVIWRAYEYEDNENYLAVPGQVASINIDGSVIVITGQRKIKITEVEYKGIRSQPSSFIKSIRKRLS